MDNLIMDNSTTTSTVGDATTSRFPLTPAAVALPTLALITLIIDLAPLIWHLRSRNLATSTLIFYILLANLMNLMNPFIWPTDDIGNWWPGFGVCDLEVKLMLGVWIGVVSCLVCILRNLARVLDTERTVISLTKAQQRRQNLIDCLLCFGAPVYMMGIHYIVQSNRYYIFAISGCTSSFDESWPSLVLVFIWPPIFCIANLYYAVLVIIRMHRYRTNFSAVLASSSSSLTKNRFMRLFWMAFTLIIVIFPVECFVLYKNAANNLSTYSWSRIHGLQAWAVIMIPTQGSVSFDRWVQIGAGILVFLFFGLGQDAIKEYKKGLLKMGLGRICPSLSSKRSESNFTGSQTSYSSRLRLFVAKKNPLWRKSVLLSSNDPNSPISSPHSFIVPINQSGTPPTVAELDGGKSESTAPPTLLSTTEKHVDFWRPQGLTWLGRSLFNTHNMHEQRQELAGPGEMAIGSRNGHGGNSEKAEHGNHGDFDFEV